MLSGRLSEKDVSFTANHAGTRLDSKTKITLERGRALKAMLSLSTLGAVTTKLNGDVKWAQTIILAMRMLSLGLIRYKSLSTILVLDRMGLRLTESGRKVTTKSVM